MTSKNYILIYYQQIKDGTVTVGKWIELWYEYIIKGLQEKWFFFDNKKASRAIAFIQQYCRHHEGMLGGQLIRLEIWQKALLSVVFGICSEDGTRQFRECFVVMGRKNGKTLLDAAVAAYMMVADGEYGGRAYFVSSKLDQARLAYEAFYQMIEKDPRLSKLAKKRRTDIYFAESNSSAMPMSSNERKMDGLNPSYVSLDELASWRGEAGMKLYEVFKSALGARKQPLMFGISTAGYESDGIYDELMKRSTAVLQGTSQETRLAPFLYIIDDESKWNDIDELQKSNPNLNVSITADYLLEEIRIAEGSLSKKNEFLCKNCNIKTNSVNAWLPASDIRKCFEKRFTLDEVKHSYALGGVDLSRSVDLTCAIIMLMKGDEWIFFPQFFMPRNKLEIRTAEDGLPYDIYVKKGYLTLSGENDVDYHDVTAWFNEKLRKYEIIPLHIGYDRWSAPYWVQEMEANAYQLESVTQGPNLTGVLYKMEAMIKDGKLKCATDNDLMKMHMMDSALKQIDGNKVKLEKINSRRHIDGMAALSDAFCMHTNYWEQDKARLMNKR